MEAIRRDSPSARAIAAAIGEPFTLIDVGCSGGVDRGWDLFGERLVAYGFDPGRHEIERLTAGETRPGVRYVNGFVGLPDGPGKATPCTCAMSATLSPAESPHPGATTSCSSWRPCSP